MSGLDSECGQKLLSEVGEVEQRFYLALDALVSLYQNDALMLIAAVFLGGAEAEAEKAGKLATDEITIEVDGRKITIEAKQT